MDQQRRQPILFITRKWHGNGGMQRLSQDLATGLQQLYGDQFHVCYPRHPGFLSFLFFVVRALGMARAQHATDGHLLLGDASLVFLPTIFTGKSRVSILAHGLDVVYSLHLYQRLLPRKLKQAHRIVCVSRATADTVLQRGASPEQIVIIPCGIPPTVKLVSAERDPHLIVTVGRLVPRKGQAWFVREILPLVRKTIPDAKLVIIGDGPEKSRILATARNWNLESCVQVKTSCTDEERTRIVASATVFVMPNIALPDDMEGFGIVCLEAAACGTQVLASSVEGVPDAVIEEQTGELFTIEDTRGGSAILVRMMQNPMKPADVERAARNRYDWSLLLPRYRDEVFT
jgi:glycosyltransferase involved in cell wall biosynthesis